MTSLKNSGSFWYRKKLSSWQAYLEYFSRFSAGLSLGHSSTKLNSVNVLLLLSVTINRYAFCRES